MRSERDARFERGKSKGHGGDDRLPQPLADLGNRLAREARGLGQQHPGRRFGWEVLGRSTYPNAAPRGDRAWDRSPWSSGAAALAAVVAGVLLLIVSLPSRDRSGGGEAPDSGSRASAGDSSPAAVMAEAGVAAAEQDRLASFSPRQPDGYESQPPAGNPAFLRRVSGPELEALIDLWDAAPAASGRVSI